MVPIEFHHKQIPLEGWVRYLWLEEDYRVFHQGGIAAVLTRLRAQYARYDFRTVPERTQVDLQEDDPWQLATP